MNSLATKMPRLRLFGNLVAEIKPAVLGSKQGQILKGFRTFENNQPNRSYSQIWKRTLAAEAAVKVAPKIEDENEVNLETLGRRREKIDIDGVKINWDKAGTGDHVVLMLPGIIGCIQHDFAKLFQKMDKSKYTLVSWDPPGYGLSRPPDRDFTGLFYRRDAHIVVKLMEKLGFDKYSLLGWSNGGITGNYIAFDFPDRVRHLVSFGAHAYADEQAVMFTKVMGDLDMWSPKMLEPAIAMYGREYLQKMMIEWHEGTARTHADKLDNTLKNGMRTIKCPTLIIHGEDDPVLGVEHAEYFRDNIPNAKLWIVPGGKHNLHLKFTDKFLEVVTQFLDTNEIPKEIQQN